MNDNKGEWLCESCADRYLAGDMPSNASKAPLSPTSVAGAVHTTTLAAAAAAPPVAPSAGAAATTGANAGAVSTRFVQMEFDFFGEAKGIAELYNCNITTIAAHTIILLYAQANCAVRLATVFCCWLDVAIGVRMRAHDCLSHFCVTIQIASLILLWISERVANDARRCTWLVSHQLLATLHFGGKK